VGAAVVCGGYGGVEGGVADWEDAVGEGGGGCEVGGWGGGGVGGWGGGGCEG